CALRRAAEATSAMTIRAPITIAMIAMVDMLPLLRECSTPPFPGPGVSNRSSAGDAGADAEAGAVMQVVPVHPSAVEAALRGVGVDQHRGDPVEARRTAQAHRDPPAVLAEAQ